MNVLLDTHVFIWMDISRNRLSQAVTELLINPENTIYLSLTSIWEMQIKIRINKLKLNAPLSETLATQQEANGILLLPIRLNHILKSGELPLHHSDPFDRLRIAQAQVENLTLVTNDFEIQRYAIEHLW